MRAVRVIKLLASYGNMAAAKTVMKLRGVDVGPPRLPVTSLAGNQQTERHRDLDQLGFFK